MLDALQIKNNWDKFLALIENNITGDRKNKLLDFYKKYEERFILMPASHKPQYHNCFPGGYIDHVIRVVQCALELNKIWVHQGAVQNYTEEELMFACINHDLGKFGTIEEAAYIEQTDEWRRDKLGEMYTFNDKLEFMSVPDRSLYLLLSHGIEFSKNEMLAIKLHDGIYDEANKPYLINWLPEQKPRSPIVYIIHQADLMASRLEFERVWLPQFEGAKKKKLKENKTNSVTSSVLEEKSDNVKLPKSSSFNDVMDKFFK